MDTHRELLEQPNTQIKKEIPLCELEDHLLRYNGGGPTNNYLNLINFASALQHRLRSQFNIEIGLYVVGGFVKPDFSTLNFGSGRDIIHGDIDLIVTSNDRELLVPYRELPEGGVLTPHRHGPERYCPLSCYTLAVLNSEGLHVEGMKPQHYDWGEVEELGVSGDFFLFIVFNFNFSKF